VKRQSIALQMVLVSLMAIFGVGCAQSGSGFSVSNPASSNISNLILSSGTTTTSTTGPLNADGSANQGVVYLSSMGGAVAAFKPDNMSVLTAYAYDHALNAPTDFAISVNLTNNGSQQYGGTVMLAYNDNGTWHPGQFVSGSNTVQVSGNNWYTGLDDRVFNVWFNWQSKTVFHGFFQDAVSSVVLVMDQPTTSGLGDGLTSGTYSGSLYFKIFNPGYAYQSPEMCWFIENGPFDCQTFLVNGQVNTTSALYPANGYTRLGTFSGMNIKTAFNQ